MKKLSPMTVRRKIAAANAAMESIRELHARMIADAMNRCPHDWQYSVDPAGDSGEFDCSICGKSVSRIPDEDTP